MATYDAPIDLENRNLSHTQVIELVGQDKTVLDVGCATGSMARALAARGCRVSGVDVDAETAEAARPDLDELLIADLNSTQLSEHFKAGSFDVLIFADVLEHVLEPQRVLRDALALLAPGGRVVVSIPNVTHGSVRLALLQGRWRYTETGLLDRTHIRFFTRTAVLELLESVGLVVEELRATVADPLAVEVKVDADRIPATVVEWVRHQPDALTYQFIAAARPRRPDEEPGTRPALVPALPDDAVRRNDRHTQRMQEEQALRHRLLTTRDHVIGLEAQVKNAEARADTAEARAAEARARLKRAEQTLARERKELAREREEMVRSRTWRAGRLVTAPIRVLRRGR